MPPSDADTRPLPTSAGQSLAGLGADAQAVDSEVLLRGQRTLAICHNGEIYRLQATRLGKLILTK